MGSSDAIITLIWGHLQTDDWRAAAIKTYLKMGFVPFLFTDDMPARWRAVCDLAVTCRSVVGLVLVVAAARQGQRQQAGQDAHEHRLHRVGIRLLERKKIPDNRHAKGVLALGRQIRKYSE